MKFISTILLKSSLTLSPLKKQFLQNERSFLQVFPFQYEKGAVADIKKFSFTENQRIVCITAKSSTLCEHAHKFVGHNACKGRVNYDQYLPTKIDFLKPCVSLFRPFSSFLFNNPFLKPSLL